MTTFEIKSVKIGMDILSFPVVIFAVCKEEIRKRGKDP
jgi:hypothetical protein